MKNKNLVNWVNPDNEPTVNRRSRLTSVQDQYSVGLSKFLTTLLLLLTLGVGQMWAYDVEKNTYIYFDNSKSNWSYSYTYFVINDTHGWKMTAITNTKLFVHKRTDNTWGGYSHIRLAGNGSDWGEGNVMGGYDNMNSYIANFTNTYNNYGFGADNLYYIKPNKGGSKSDQASLSVGHIGSSYTALNKTITVKAKVSTDNGGSYSETTSPATLTAASNKFSDYQTCGTGTSLSSGTIVCGYTATTTLTAPTTDPSGYKFVGWYDSDGNQKTTSKTLTIYPTGDATYYAYYRKLYTISASTTVVWDLCGNEKSWSASYLYGGIEGGSTISDAMTQCGSTTQYRKTYANATSNIKYLMFRNNTSNFNDYTQTTDFYRDLSGVTLFEFDNTFTDKKLNWQVTTGAKKATSGTKVYFDNTATNWSEVWLKYGTTRFNRHTGTAATKVTGTDNLYVITMPEAYYVKWYFADAYGYTNRNSIETMTSINNRINYQTTDLTSDITYIPSTGSGTPKVWNTTTLSGHTRTLTFGSHTNGNITVRYTDESGTERTVSSASVSSVSVAQTCKVIITAVPNSGYAPSTLTLGGASITSGAQQIIRADGTIVATFVAEETHDVTVSYKIGSRTLHADQTFEVGVTTASNISSEEIDGFSFSSWSNLSSDIVNNTGNLTTDPININTTVDGGDCSMTCNYVQWPCSLDINTTSGNTGYTSRVAMTYDATAKAYYKEFTTTAATHYFRFYINSKKYAPSSDTEVPIDGTTVTAATDVTGYASSMPSVYFNDGGSGSKIKVWFDYEAKKAWVEEVKYTVTIASGGNGTVSPTSVSVGNVVASGTITATASDHYHWSSWTVPSGATIASGTGTRSITIKATAAVTVTANFAGDQYTISYKDQGDVSYSGSNLASLPTTHTYGTATALVNGTKTGYDFVGWYTDASCTSSAGSSIGATAKTANFTLYAKWSAKNYTNTNNLKEADGTANGQYNVTYDNTSIAHTSAPSRTGYTIEGYYKQAAWTNKIANTNLSLVASTDYATSASKWKVTSAPDLYIKWQQSLTLAGNGAGSTNGSVTTTYLGTASSHTAATRTGYTLNGYYDNTSGGNKILTNTGALVTYSASVSDYINSSGKWIYNGTPTLSAQWTAKTYTVTLAPNGGSGSNQTVTATYDAAMPGTLSGGGDIVAPTRTGYDFDGYWYSSTQYYDEDLNSVTNWNRDGATTLNAKWDAKSYTVTLDIDEDNHGTIDGKDTEASVTFDAAPTSIASGKLPTAANGYALDGYYTDHDGEGLKVINGDGTWIASVTGYTDGSKNWIHDGDVTLYAYYKKAEITNLAFDNAVVESNATVGITPTISPTPEGSTTLCWYVYYSNDNKLDPQPEMSFSAGKLTFQAPEASGTYKVAAVLRTGSGSCPYVGGTLLDSAVTSFQVAGLHTVTIRYKCGDEVIKEATSITARPLDWSDEIAAPEIFGYTFKRWSAGDGVTLTADDGVSTNTDTTATPIKIIAVYDGYLTATYTKKDYIYFKNTMGWSDVYVYFYTSDKYWDDIKYGSGTWKDKPFKNGDDNDHKPYWDQKHGHLTQLDGTDIWYFDVGSIGCRDWSNIVFNANQQDNYEWFSATELVRRGDFKRKTPMFVPADKTKYTPTTKNTSANYYNKGYWVNYLGENTGYTLEVYQSDGSTLVKSLKFTSEDKLMPMSATLNLEAGTTYKFHLKRDGNSSGDVYYGNTGTMKYDSRYGGNATPWSFESGVGKCGLVTTAAGDYTFHLTYSQNAGGEYALRIAVEYPIADGDYRVLYKDDVHTAFKPSAIVPKVNNGKDTVSYFIRPGQSPVMMIQQASVNNEGATSWSVGTDVSSSLSALSKDSVYNICLTMNESGAISVEKVEAYTGNYYIRTDAANSKWDNWKSDPDHLMTYSEYSINHGGYSHYYCHWVRSSDTGRKNVKFCIANDYSPCISDTLIRESNAVSGWENIDNYITSGGDLQRNANVRFMWNRHDNTISRAYVDGAQGDHSANFLYMLNTDSPNKIRWSEESALTSNKVTFSDNGNWIYEANIQAQPNAQIRLLSNWGESNTVTQYFKGSSSTSEDLVGGSGSTWYDIRIIYDFKTNRLVSSWIPSGEISGNVEINADVMFIREHQGDIAQLTFTTGSKISKIETAYGVLRLNKWTLNNKDKSTHTPLGTLISRYERDLFYISFPFRVSMEEVFGFGTYGTHWIIEEYDGAGRAANGYWLESKPNWKFVTNRKNKYFEPGQGYIIALDLDELDESSSVWDNTDQVELYFPSYGTMPDITSSSATYNIPSHLCTINRSGESNGNGGTLGAAYDRRVKDSHWNVLGVPTYVNPDAPTFANTTWITTGDGHVGPNFLYAWNPDDNTVTAVSGTGYDYHAMHAYLVQYCGDVTWTSSVSPTTAPRRNPDYRGEYEFRLEMLQDNEAIDQTYVKLSDDEHVTTGFEFNYDLSKEFNKNKANIYTLIGTEQAAGNVLPLTDQTTVVPVGVQIATDGDYTFAIPNGTEGIGVTLIDNETSIRTPLSALDYTVYLTAGTIDGRFVLEISPIAQNPTDIEAVSEQDSAVRKVMIDGILYIVKGNRIYDATGALVK